MVYHLAVEARRPPSWLTDAHRDLQRSRLRAGLGELSRSASLRWMDDSTLAVLLRYESQRRHTRDPHQAVLASVMRAVTQAGLYPTKAVVKQVATHWTEGAFAGALTGLGLSQTQDDDVQPAIALGAIVIGAVLGAFLRREVPVFRGAFLPATGWRLIAVEPEVSSTRFRVGFA